MECHDIQKKLEAFMDGELTPEEGAVIIEHLDSCPGCRTELVKLTAADQLVAQTQGLDPGEEAWARMRAGIREGISRRPVVSRPGIMDWIRWLVSPRYAVIKVGAALAVMALALVISRELTVSRLTPSRETVPESAISSRTGGKLSEEKAPERSIEIQESKPAMSEQKTTAPKSRESRELSETAPKKVGQLVEGTGSLKDSKGAEAPSIGIQGSREKQSEIMKEDQAIVLENEAIASPDASLEELPPVAEDTVRQSRLKVESLGEVLQTPSGVQVDNEGEQHVRGGRSSQVLPSSVKGMQKQESPPRGRETPALSTQATLWSRDREALLTGPFSDKSYWETYGVTLDPTVEAQTGLDSLWAEFHLCAGEPCEQDVAPYLVEALFFQASQSDNPEDIGVAKRYMTLHRELLTKVWGDQRYGARWEELLKLEKQ